MYRKLKSVTVHLKEGKQEFFPETPEETIQVDFQDTWVVIHTQHRNITFPAHVIHSVEVNFEDNKPKKEKPHEEISRRIGENPRYITERASLRDYITERASLRDLSDRV